MKLKIVACILVLIGLLLSAATCFAAACIRPVWFGNGEFYFGGTLGLDTQYFDYRQNFANTIGDQRAVYEFNGVTTNSGSGGLLFGYQKIYQRFGWGVEAKGVYNANIYADAWDHISASGGGFNIHHKFKIPYQFDLLFKPMLMLGHSSFVYLPIGATYARLHYLLQIFDDNQHVLITAAKKDKFLWGFFTGLGLEKKITNKCNVFAEDDIYFLSSNKFTKWVVSADPAFAANYIFKSRQFINAIRVGVRVFVG